MRIRFHTFVSGAVRRSRTCELADALRAAEELKYVEGEVDLRITGKPSDTLRPIHV
jgi:hypothetical protein